jgi:hypothetical protein
MSAQKSAVEVSPPTANYQASHIKRFRATRAAIEERRLALYDIVADMQPMTVRQVFYQATVKGIVEKTEVGYTPRCRQTWCSCASPACWTSTANCWAHFLRSSWRPPRLTHPLNPGCRSRE